MPHPLSIPLTLITIITLINNAVILEFQLFTLLFFFFCVCSVFGCDASLRAERRGAWAPGVGADWDRPLVILTSLCMHWLPAVLRCVDEPAWKDESRQWLFGGVLLSVGGTVGFCLPMRWNPFFSSLVRIQTDRGHHVIDTGPYAIVRHPGYAFGIIPLMVAPSLLLRTRSAIAVSVAGIFLTFVRCAWEDQTLQQELRGYKEYAQRVRYRLIPLLF